MNAFNGFDSMAERRKRLLAAMQGQAGQQVLGHGARPIYGGGKRMGAGDMAPMGHPGLTFNPLINALAKGQQGLHAPSQLPAVAAAAGATVSDYSPPMPGQQQQLSDSSLQQAAPQQQAYQQPMMANEQQGQVYDPFAGQEGQGGSFNLRWRVPNYSGITAPPPPPEPLLGQYRLGRMMAV